METKEQKQYYITVKGQKVPVSEEVYRAYVRPVEASEREERRNSKCLVKGERSGLVRCKEDCSKCPYHMAGNKLLGGKLSLDGLIDQGYEESSGEDIESEVIERQEKNKRTEALHKAIARLAIIRPVWEALRSPMLMRIRAENSITTTRTCWTI